MQAQPTDVGLAASPLGESALGLDEAESLGDGSADGVGLALSEVGCGVGASEAVGLSDGVALPVGSGVGLDVGSTGVGLGLADSLGDGVTLGLGSAGLGSIGLGSMGLGTAEAGSVAGGADGVAAMVTVGLALLEVAAPVT